MIKNIVQTLFSKGFTAIFNFLILIISSRYLGVETRGEISLFILNIANIQIINEVYTGFSLVYFIPKFNLRKIISNGLIWTFITTLLSNLVFYLLNKQILGFELDMLFLSLIIIINTFNMVILLAKERIRLYNFLSVLQPFMLLLGIIFFMNVLNEFTFKAYVIPLYISFSFTFIISTLAVLKIVRSSASKTEYSLKPILKNGFYCQLAGLCHVLANRYSWYFFSTSALIGVYSAASSLIESVWIISTGISPVILSKISNTGDTDFNRRITFTMAKISFVFSCLAVTIIYFLPQQLFVFLLGLGFEEVKSIMLWICPGILFISFSTIISHYFSGLGMLKYVAFCNTVGFLFTLISAPYMIREFNMQGAAIIANCSYFISSTLLLSGFLVKTKFGFKELFYLKQDYINLKQAF